MLRYLAVGLFLPLLLVACSKEYSSNPDARSLLASLDGPKVSGVNETLYTNAKEAEKGGNTEQAAQFYQQLVDAEPENAKYRTSLADAMRRLGDPQGALVNYDVALKAEPEDASALEGRALAFLQLGEFTTAGEQLSSLMRSGKGGWRTYNALGILASGNQKPEEAQGYFNKALAFAPGNASIRNNMALALGVNRQYDASLAKFDEASKLAATNSEALKKIEMNSAIVYAASGQLEQAEAITRKYFEGAALNNNMGFYAHVANDEELARTYMNMALSQSKTFYSRAWTNLEALKTDGSGGTQVSGAPNSEAPVEKRVEIVSDQGNNVLQAPAGYQPSEQTSVKQLTPTPMPVVTAQGVIEPEAEELAEVPTAPLTTFKPLEMKPVESAIAAPIDSQSADAVKALNSDEEVQPVVETTASESNVANPALGMFDFFKRGSQRESSYSAALGAGPLGSEEADTDEPIMLTEESDPVEPPTPEILTEKAPVVTAIEAKVEPVLPATIQEATYDELGDEGLVIVGGDGGELPEISVEASSTAPVVLGEMSPSSGSIDGELDSETLAASPPAVDKEEKKEKSLFDSLF